MAQVQFFRSAAAVLPVVRSARIFTFALSFASFVTGIPPNQTKPNQTKPNRYGGIGVPVAHHECLHSSSMYRCSEAHSTCNLQHKNVPVKDAWVPMTVPCHWVESIEGIEGSDSTPCPTTGRPLPCHMYCQPFSPPATRAPPHEAALRAFA